MSETELKLVLDEATANAVWGRARALKLATQKPVRRTLRSIYFDTPDHALKAAGISLRLRRDGRRWIQTVKIRAGLHGGLSQAEEVESPAPGGKLCIEAIPVEAVRAEVSRRVDGAALHPVCETLIERRAGRVALADGTLAELAVDVGDIRAAGRSAELREAEIELLEGSPAGLFGVAGMLFPEGGLHFSRFSKAARGYLLAETGAIDPPLEPRNALPTNPRRGLTAEQAAQDILRECFDQIATNMLVVRALNDPEGPHQLRVGLRRLRSVFSVHAPVLGGAEMERLAGEARWLGQEVGLLRDLDVAADGIVRREAERHPGEPGLMVLAQALSERAGGQRRQLRLLLAEGRAQRFLLDLACFAETRGWLAAGASDQPRRPAPAVADLAGAALARCWKKVRRRAKGLESLDVEQRHELRKALKKLRYAVEFFAALYPKKRVAPFLKRLKRLQLVFGDLNDAATVKAMLSDASLAGGDIVVHRAVGWMLGASQARAELGWTGAKALWRELHETRPFWE
jgi:inorganic triphosphatase YgiF